MHDDSAAPQESVGGAPRGEPVGHNGTRVEIDEREARTHNGWFGVFGGLVGIGVAIALFSSADGASDGAGGVLGVLGLLVFLLSLCLFAAVSVVSPGETKVVQFFGRYVGTIRRPGIVLTPLLSTRRRVSVRVRNFETTELKVNDADGNPVNIAAIVVWQVADTARASFAVESFRVSSRCSPRPLSGTWRRATRTTTRTPGRRRCGVRPTRCRTSWRTRLPRAS